MELDLLNILNFQRVSEFDQKTSLRRHQRFLVDYFLRYTVQNKELDQDENQTVKKTMALDNAIRKCKPEEDSIFDRRIYYEIMGKVFDQKDAEEISTYMSVDSGDEEQEKRDTDIEHAYDDFMRSMSESTSKKKESLTPSNEASFG